MSSEKFIIGRGTKVHVALLPPGSNTEIVPQTITSSALAAAAATSLSVEAITEALTASSAYPIFLSFADAVDGTDKPAKVVANAADSATSLTVATLVKAINDGSTAEYPVKLHARTGVDINPNANDTTTQTFDDDGYETGVVTRLGYGVSCPGNFLSMDAGFKTCFYAFNEFKNNIWLRIELPAPDGYTTGYVFKGSARVTNMPLNVPAGEIVTCNIEFKFNGKPTIVDPSV